LIIPRVMRITDCLVSCDLPIQLRNRDADTRALLEMARALRAAPFLTINERIDIALAVGADGVHLPEWGMSSQLVKRLKASLLVGVSVHSLESGLRAQGEGADYLIFGPIFATPGKVPCGLGPLEQLVRQIKIPVIAVGGITRELAGECLAAGAYGVAGIRGMDGWTLPDR